MEMSRAQIDEFLEGVHIARVATVRPDGRPHVAPIWFLWDGDYLYFETEDHTVKARNLRKNRNLAITIDISAGGLRLKYVILEGRAELIEDLVKVKKITRSIFQRYVGREGLETPSIMEMLAAANLVVALKPDRMISLDDIKPAVLSVL